MIGREAPLAELSRSAGLHAGTFESPAPLVIVYGGASTGKSMGVSQALNGHSAPHALVDCTALYSAKEFYRETLAQLQDGATVAEAEEVTISVGTRAKETEENDGKIEEDDEKFSSLNFLGFFKALDTFMQNVAKDDEPSRRVLYLALDHVDKLLDRGLGALITCICTINDQISYLNMFAETPPWEACVLLITRGMSLDFDRLVMPFFPAYVHFPPYKPGQLADILVEQLNMKEANEMFRTWLVHLHGLLPPAPDGDWLEFRAAVVHLLPEFHHFFMVPVADAQASKMKNKLERDTKGLVQTFLQTRRRHLFGYHKLDSGVGDPSELISCSNLSRNCLLLVLAGYLASFNPQETDVRFLSSSGGQRRKKRAKKNPEGETSKTSSNKKHQISQLLIGPRIFTLQRLLAIYLNLRVEDEAGNSYIDESRSSETREEVFTHLATLVRMQLFQRTTPPHVLDNIKFRCLADARFVQETARYLSFPLDAYLNRST
ncbi:Origin recognition complex subunit 5 [Phytophthora citrophthora]|uniref:Origin recognition complex subunit 5 n=1 Tax=Phytophthora citrophthora TaxID=4793 RepID=A0AAD9GK33_9STRA|nr:Origin recognition complex subunit 5 [Phytophthora citrophthora]